MTCCDGSVSTLAIPTGLNGQERMSCRIPHALSPKSHTFTYTPGLSTTFFFARGSAARARASAAGMLSPGETTKLSEAGASTSGGGASAAADGRVTPHVDASWSASNDSSCGSRDGISVRPYLEVGVRGRRRGRGGSRCEGNQW